MSSRVQYVVEDGVAWVTLNKPPLNILDTAMLRELAQALRRAEEDPSASVVVLRAAGKAFSAGADVRDHMADRLDAFIDAFNGVIYTMWSMEKPVVAGVHGFALGGGCEILLACDVVIAAKDAKIGQPEITVGVYPPVAVVLMPMFLGYSKAAELILTGEAVTGEEAERLGLVNKAVAPEDLEKALREYASKLKEKSPIVLRITKKALRRALGVDELAKRLKEVTEIYLNELMKTEDANEGLRAFMEKRKPSWRGI